MEIAQQIKEQKLLVDQKVNSLPGCEENQEATQFTSQNSPKCFWFVNIMDIWMQT